MSPGPAAFTSRTVRIFEYMVGTVTLFTLETGSRERSFPGTFLSFSLLLPPARGSLCGFALGDIVKVLALGRGLREEAFLKSFHSAGPSSSILPKVGCSSGDVGGELENTDEALEALERYLSSKKLELAL